MAVKILDGKKRAEQITTALNKQMTLLSSRCRNVPEIVTITLARDASSSLYINSQQRLASSLGIRHKTLAVKAPFTEKKIIDLIDTLNSDSAVSGIIIQNPLPHSVNISAIRSSISPIKDVEGLHPQNMGALFLGRYKIAPPTALAVMELLRLTGASLYGKKVVIIGHSEIAGKPLSIMLLNEFATVSVCHIATSERGDIKEYIKMAQILIVAVGKPNLVKGDLIKRGAIVIDVGINRVKGEIIGDVEFEEAKKRASYISPVPGGVGPLTTAMLMRNSITLFKMQNGLA